MNIAVLFTFTLTKSRCLKLRCSRPSRMKRWLISIGKNKESLLLSETILKGFYVVMPAQSHELGDMRKAMSAKEMDKVESIAVKNGAVTSYFTDGWKPVSELRKNGFLSLNTNGNYPSDHLFTFSEDGKVYML